jgi:uncharacterized protein (DUF4415 family)
MIFHNLLESNFSPKPVMEAPKNELAPLFEPAAAPPPEGVTVTVKMDADVLDWLREQPTDWQRELNNLARFFMETSIIRETAFEETAGPEDELDTSGPDPARNADRIDNEFIPP